MIPENYKQFCKSPSILACDYYIDKDCPNTCGMARRLKQGIKHRSRTGLERFERKYPEYLGIGTIVNLGGAADNSTNGK